MAHFSYYFPLGVCPPVTVIPNSFFSQTDQKLFKAINGDDGGTWAPSSIITIGGFGLQVTGAFFVNSVAELTGSAEIGSSHTDFLNVFATSTFSSPAGFASISVSGIATLNEVNCTDVTATGTVVATVLSASGGAFTGSFHATGTSTLDGTVNAGGALNVAGDTELHAVATAGNLNIANGATLTAGVMVCSGNGRVARPSVVGAASGGGTASVQVANEYYFPSVVADQVYAISDSGAVNGDWLEFWTESTTNGVTINDPLGVSLQTIKNSTGNFAYAKVKRILGSWKLVGISLV